MEIALGIMLPFIGTVIGTSIVFLMKNFLNKNIENILLGFASGVMIAASIWSLIIPSLEIAKSQNIIEWFPAVIGFIFGVIFLIFTDISITKFEDNLESKQNSKTFKNCFILYLAVTLHNIPEGMAVGVAFSGVIFGKVSMSIVEAMSLAIGIGIQNIPEGAIISMPLKSLGFSKIKSFIYGVFSGIVEPIAAVITILITSRITVILPYILAFAAGAMMYVVTNELIPKSQEGKKNYFGILGITIGFLIMMILDVALG